MDDDSDPFHFSVLPIDPLPDEEPTEPSFEVQKEALDDICSQLVTYLTAAAKDKSDPLRPAYILAHCDRICDVYACAGFNLFSEFQQELRTDLRTALRKVRSLALSSSPERGASLNSR
jgi:hypothetical protein